MTKPEQYIIDKPGLKSGLRNGAEVTITLVAWLVWIYLLMPLITLTMWMIGLRLIILEQLMLSGVSGLISVAGYYLAGVVVIWVVFQIWSAYNRRKFGRIDRRRRADPVRDDELAEYFAISVDNVAAAKTMRRVSVSFDNEKMTLLPGE